MVPVLLDSVMEREFAAQVAVLDRGYDSQALYDRVAGHPPGDPAAADPRRQGRQAQAAGLRARHVDVRGVRRQAGRVRVRCPTGECKPASVWVKADRLHTLIPRTTDRWKGLYCQRGAVEREFGRLKHEWAMLPLRVRRINRVRLHVDLAILAQLASALLTTRTL
jgi:hypothetical protein